ncbi:hypothetical protein OPV22_012505 [Ensete ventricosum]|uniref:Cytochrome P450 n=1 Tax=Ensete ventricosum TaxID=4639 RepID=A0AAV8QYS5_ENSVE|nr:hypothetical protein OPV22_012505 [Ensete ventricosum]
MDWQVGISLVVIIFSCFLWLVKGRRQTSYDTIRKDAKIPNGTNGLPLLGETLEFMASNYTTTHVSFMRKRRSLYGKVFRSNILGRPIIMSTDPEVNKIVLQDDGRTFVPSYPRTVVAVMGETSILSMTGDQHKKYHGIVAKFLKAVPVMERVAKEIEQSMELAFRRWKDKPQIYLQDEINQITFEILVRMLLGIDPGQEMDLVRTEFYELIKAIICIPVKFPGTTLYKSMKSKEKMVELIKEIIRYKVEKGQDSVPMITTLAIKYLTDHPAAIKQLREENLELKRQKIQSGEPYTWSEYTSLPFTQNVINETLRMANIVNAVWRRCLKDVEIKGYLIPKGWCIMTSFSSVHLDEEIYEDPFKFNPWRWEGKGQLNQNNFTPFGGGQRLCPGYHLAKMEIAVILHHFITGFSWVEAEPDTVTTFPRVRMKKKFPVIVSPISD